VSASHRLGFVGIVALPAPDHPIQLLEIPGGITTLTREFAVENENSVKNEKGSLTPDTTSWLGRRGKRGGGGIWRGVGRQGRSAVLPTAIGSGWGLY
jgi:hypothetical protein